MSDNRLRELERRFRETGSDEDEVAWLRERAREGLADVDALTAAAQLGQPIAREILGWPKVVPAEVQELVRGIVFVGSNGSLLPESSMLLCEHTPQTLAGRKWMIQLVAKDLRDRSMGKLPDHTLAYLDETISSCSDSNDLAAALVADLAHIAESISPALVTSCIAYSAMQLLRIGVGTALAPGRER